MTTKRHNPLRCQRCHHNHATHSLLGKILLCSSCFTYLIGQDAQLTLALSTSAYVGPIPKGLYHLD